MDASREGRSLAEFKYACVGYSVYSNGKDPTADVQETQAELPVCVGLEVIILSFLLFFHAILVLLICIILLEDISKTNESIHFSMLLCHFASCYSF